MDGEELTNFSFFYGPAMIDIKPNNNVSTKTILFMPLDRVGYMNSLIGVAACLRRLGHRTVFLFIDPVDDELQKIGHEVYVCTNRNELVESNPSVGSEPKWGDAIKMGKFRQGNVLKNFFHTTLFDLHGMAKDIMKNNDNIAKKLDLLKPDLIVVDHYFASPALLKYRGGIPWVRVCSTSPLALHKRASKLPPATLGLPTLTWWKNPQYVEWDEKVREVNMELYHMFNDYLTKEHSIEPLSTDPISFLPKSPWLNIYIYPKELDYDHVGEPEDWIQCDSMLQCNIEIPTEEEEELCKTFYESKGFFQPPKKLFQKPGKLIYFSMGSVASGDLNLMRRLIDILSKAPHRFIVCKGVHHDQLELADNMWGGKFVNQIAVLQQVDLIITHGGNITITEAIYYGVPGIIVCPVFSDQHDNAQRIVEKGLGYKVNPYHCKARELLDTIEEALHDNGIRKRMEAISERMQMPENKYKAIKLFIDLVNKI